MRLPLPDFAGSGRGFSREYTGTAVVVVAGIVVAGIVVAGIVVSGAIVVAAEIVDVEAASIASAPDALPFSLETAKATTPTNKKAAKSGANQVRGVPKFITKD